MHPNATWCIDFKGDFLVGQRRCYPLTVMDAYSRFLLCCVALPNTRTEGVQRALLTLFQTSGLPDAIRSDNGSPFASKAPAGLSGLSAWWLKLGIRHERIEPGKPQQNGRHERMHLTLPRHARAIGREQPVLAAAARWEAVAHGRRWSAIKPRVYEAPRAAACGAFRITGARCSCWRAIRWLADPRRQSFTYTRA